MRKLLALAVLTLTLTCFADPPLYQLKLRHESKTLVGVIKTDLTAAFFGIEASKDGGQTWQLLFYAYPNQEFALPSSDPHIEYRALCILLRPPPGNWACLAAVPTGPGCSTSFVRCTLVPVAGLEVPREWCAGTSCRRAAAAFWSISKCCELPAVLGA